MNENQSAIMFFNGSQYTLANIVALGKIGPTINIQIEDINLYEGPNQKTEHVVVFNPPQQNPAADDGSIVFYKQHGRYTVLLGKNTLVSKILVKDFTNNIKGRLISTPALKKARIEKITIAALANTLKPLGYQGSKPIPGFVHPNSLHRIVSNGGR